MAIVTAASTSRADFILAMADCVAGDTLQIPAGSSTWDSSVTLDKQLIIAGAGKAQTLLTMTGNGIQLNNKNGSRVTGIWFYGNSTSTSAYLILADCTSFSEVDHCHFESNTGNKQIAIYYKSPSGQPDPLGLVHHCTFVNDRILMQGDSGTGFGRDVWANSARVPGTSDSVFIEDNEFTNTLGGNVVDDEFGGHYVFRHNTINASSGGTIEAHGISSTVERGNKFVEIYGNSLIRDTETSYLRPFFLRGGQALVYDNALTTVNGGEWNQDFISLDSEVRTASTTGKGNGVADGNLPIAIDTSPYWYHDGSDGASVLTASGASWTTDEFAGMTLYNRTDGSSGAVTANTANTITATLSGGTDNDWDAGDQFFITNATGTHDGGDGQAALTDSSKSWATDEFVNALANQGCYVWNVTDGSLGSVSANNGTTVTATLADGTDNDWDDGDEYFITFGYPWRDQLGTGTDEFEYTGAGDWPEQAHGLDYACYQWDNDLDATPIVFSIENGAGTTAKEGRDYFNEEYTYTPYTYPHPDASDALDPPAATVPNAPTDLTLTAL